MADVRRSPANPEMNPRALIVRLGAMGDVIHALPAVAMLRHALPEAQIGWVVEQRWRELLCAPGIELAGPPCAGRPLLDELHLVDTRAWRKRPFSPAVGREFLSAIHLLRARHYDAALDLQGAIKSALLARLSGAGLVLGFRQPRESLARWLYGSVADGRRASATGGPSVGPYPSPNPSAHVIEQNVELVQSWLERIGHSPGEQVHRQEQEQSLLPHICQRPADMGHPALVAPATAALLPGTNLLPRDPASEARIADILEATGLSRSPIAILNPGAGWAAKQWAPSRYAELAIHLAARGLRSVVNYGPGEQTLAGAVVAASNGRAVALPTTLSEFIALARRGHLFVGGDTGPMHLAALLGVRTVALFGPTDPARNGPYWAATRVLRDPASTTSYSHRRTLDSGLEKLTVERVLAEIDALLS
jgi:heptosyltransferase I